MISFCGYNFCMDKDALNPLPTNLNNISNVKIENSIYDHVDISSNVDSPYNTTIPVWDSNTIIDCTFDNTIDAGNVDFVLSQLSSIKIKRRKKGDFKWITIKEIEINNLSDLSTILRDYFVPSYEEFEYAVVPILNGVEGEYIIGSVKTEFNGIFISDVTKTYKLDKNVSYGSRTSVQEVGQITPLGRKYPVVIKNGEANYDIGSVTGLILGKNYDKTHKINRKEIVDAVEEFVGFLKNGKPKIIKDWNGLIKIIYVTGNPTINYGNSNGMAVASVTFEWAEQGKYDNENDLYDNGFIEAQI